MRLYWTGNGQCLLPGKLLILPSEKKKPCRSRAFRTAHRSLGADEFDIDTTVRLQTLDDLLALRTR
ncbi:MAG TPA: hypothetical protein PK440_20760, partial [Candidatus Accumulibacter phosphatis]|nr:hypothetical protein [Candidatus Accumulibacter phosphatis]